MNEYRVHKFEEGCFFDNISIGDTLVYRIDDINNTYKVTNISDNIVIDSYVVDDNDCPMKPIKCFDTDDTYGRRQYVLFKSQDNKQSVLLVN